MTDRRTGVRPAQIAVKKWWNQKRLLVFRSHCKETAQVAKRCKNTWLNLHSAHSSNVRLQSIVLKCPLGTKPVASCCSFWICVWTLVWKDLVAISAWNCKISFKADRLPARHSYWWWKAWKMSALPTRMDCFASLSTKAFDWEHHCSKGVVWKRCSLCALTLTTRTSVWFCFRVLYVRSHGSAWSWKIGVMSLSKQSKI